MGSIAIAALVVLVGGFLFNMALNAAKTETYTHSVFEVKNEKGEWEIGQQFDDKHKNPHEAASNLKRYQRAGKIRNWSVKQKLPDGTVVQNLGKFDLDKKLPKKK